ISGDDEERAAIREAWQAARDRSRPSPPPSSPDTAAPARAPIPDDRSRGLVIDSRALAERSSEIQRLPSAEVVTDGIVHDIQLRDVPLDQALKAILRPLNLD